MNKIIEIKIFKPNLSKIGIYKFWSLRWVIYSKNHLRIDLRDQIVNFLYHFWDNSKIKSPQPHFTRRFYYPTKLKNHPATTLLFGWWFSKLVCLFAIHILYSGCGTNRKNIISSSKKWAFRKAKEKKSPLGKHFNKHWHEAKKSLWFNLVIDSA